MTIFFKFFMQNLFFCGFLFVLIQCKWVRVDTAFYVNIFTLLGRVVVFILIFRFLAPGFLPFVRGATVIDFPSVDVTSLDLLTLNCLNLLKRFWRWDGVIESHCVLDVKNCEWLSTRRNSPVPMSADFKSEYWLSTRDDTPPLLGSFKLLFLWKKKNRESKHKQTETQIKCKILVYFNWTNWILFKRCKNKNKYQLRNSWFKLAWIIFN